MGDPYHIFLIFASSEAGSGVAGRSFHGGILGCAIDATGLPKMRGAKREPRQLMFTITFIS